MTERPVVTVDPGVSFGRPCVGGIACAAISEAIWAGEDVATVVRDYGLTREQVLTACWWLGRYGIEDTYRDNRDRLRRPGAIWRDRWGEWAWAQDEHMWRGEWEAVQDPPWRDE